MSDQQYGATPRRREDVLDQPLRSRMIEMGRRLVQHEHGRLGEQGARQREPLALTARELSALLAHERVEAVRELLDPFEEPRRAQSFEELVVARRGLGELQVLPNRCREQVRVLPGDGYRPADVLLPVATKVFPADGDASPL